MSEPVDNENSNVDGPRIAAPKCPSCAVQGVEYVVSTPSKERSRTKQPWFYIIHCANCGYVYNTLSKHSFSQPVTPNFVLPKVR